MKRNQLAKYSLRKKFFYVKFYLRLVYVFTQKATPVTSTFVFQQNNYSEKIWICNEICNVRHYTATLHAQSNIFKVGLAIFQHYG